MPRKPTRIPGVTVRQRGSTWQAQVRAGKDSRTGKYVYRCATADTEAAAWDADRRMLGEAEAQKAAHVDPTRQTVAEYMAGWLERKTAEGLSPKTMHEYRMVVSIQTNPHIGDTPLQELSTRDVQAWHDALAPTPTTPGATRAALAYRVLRSALGDAERLGLIQRNSAALARPAQRSSRKREGFTLAEAQAILRAAARERLEPLFAFMLHCGLRGCEALGVRWSDVDLEQGTLTVARDMVEVGSAMVEGKTKNYKGARTFAPIPHALEDLRRQQAQEWRNAYQEGSALIFAAENGNPLWTSNVDSAFRRVRERAGGAELAPIQHAARNSVHSPRRGGAGGGGCQNDGALGGDFL